MARQAASQSQAAARLGWRNGFYGAGEVNALNAVS